MSWFSKRPAPNPPGGEITTVISSKQVGPRNRHTNYQITVEESNGCVNIDNGRGAMYSSNVSILKEDLPVLKAMLENL